MAIRVGGGYHLDGDDGGDARRRLPPGYPRMLPTSPGYKGFTNPPMFDPGRGHNLPLVENPFELGLFEIQEDGIKNDYLVCRGFDPESKKYHSDLPIAKPRLLQKTPFDRKSYEQDGQVFTLYYPRLPGWRVRSGGDSFQSGSVFVEKIDQGYFSGDVIVAARVSYKGVSREEDGAVPLTEEGLPIDWMDLNTGARRWSPAFWDSLMMVFIDESTAYNESQSTWEADLRDWNSLVQSRGLPRWGTALCDMPVRPNGDMSSDNVAPFGVPPGITYVAMPSRIASGQNLIDAYQTALRNPEGFEDIAPPSVLAMIDNSGSMSRSILSDALSEFSQWLTDGAGIEGGYPVALNERSFADERWLRFLTANIRETGFGV